MSDLKKIRIKPLDEKDDFRLWRIRIAAACDGKGLEGVIESASSEVTAADKISKFRSDQKKASNIIVAACSDKAFRVVRADIRNPYNMLEKLDHRYDSKSAAARIAKMTELISLKYDNIRKNIGAHIDQMAGVIEQLDGMQTKIPDELAIAMLIAPIHVPELVPVAAAVKALSDDKATWDNVSARLIEEHHALRGKAKSSERASAARRPWCELCKKERAFYRDMLEEPSKSEESSWLAIFPLKP